MREHPELAQTVPLKVKASLTWVLPGFQRACMRTMFELKYPHSNWTVPSSEQSLELNYRCCHLSKEELPLLVANPLEDMMRHSTVYSTLCRQLIANAPTCPLADDL